MKNPQNQTSILTTSLSKLLVHAVLDFFPEAQIVEDWTMGPQFCLQFYLNKKLPDHQLSQIEIRMTEVQSKGFSIKEMEMIPLNAAKLFEHHKQKELAKRAVQSDLLTLHVASFDTYYDLLKISIESQGHLQSHFKLTHIEQIELPKKIKITIFGIGAENAGELKKLLKAEKEVLKESHLDLAKQQKLFINTHDNILFLPKGQKLLEGLQKLIEKEFQKNSFQKVEDLNGQLNISYLVDNENVFGKYEKYFLYRKQVQINQNPFLNGLFKLEKATYDYWISTTSNDQMQADCISYLNFYGEIIKILGFSYRVKCRGVNAPVLKEKLELFSQEKAVEFEFLSGKNLELSFEVWDRYLREQFSPSFRLKKKESTDKKSVFYFEGTFCSSIEKLLAALLEEKKENLI